MSKKAKHTPRTASACHTATGLLMSLPLPPHGWKGWQFNFGRFGSAWFIEAQSWFTNIADGGDCRSVSVLCHMEGAAHPFHIDHIDEWKGYKRVERQERLKLPYGVWYQDTKAGFMPLAEEHRRMTKKEALR